MGGEEQLFEDGLALRRFFVRGVFYLCVVFGTESPNLSLQNNVSKLKIRHQ